MRRYIEVCAQFEWRRIGRAIRHRRPPKATLRVRAPFPGRGAGDAGVVRVAELVQFGSERAGDFVRVQGVDRVEISFILEL